MREQPSFYGLLTLMFLFLNCSSSPDRLTPQLDVSALSNTANIEEFVFMVKNLGGDTTFFPNNCLNVGSTVCIPAGGCGVYSKTDASFNLNVSFSNYPNGEAITLIACALDNTQAVIAAGSETFTNSKGMEPVIMMDELDLTPCSILTPCP